ncbi:DUF4159 domain-containing protein [Labrys wisconsinensis]|uniref:DUF4159 domain-containing protein n=1 Tax=Labrys wisconsinensis TaxID=425677 RepID=A0ABU0JH70_9HYPH|nr:DUF4159 domain-containing protein [Labrys wisconsinensis]MDQ0473632.1 hypothetical protein [Labrys wisconsinensis]
MIPLAFTAPMMLLALAALPALWVLLRLVPPRPRRIDFPPLKLLLGLTPTEETPARTPWWLTALRLGLAALIILMLAGPVWNPRAGPAAGSGPLLLLVDNGWASARDWELRTRVVEDRIAAAEAAGRSVALLATAEPAADLSLAAAPDVRAHLRALRPEPWTPDRAAHLKSLSDFLTREPAAEIVWFADGLAARPDAFVDGLKTLLAGRPVEVVQDTSRGALALAGADNAPGALTVRVLRALDGAPPAGVVRARDVKGLPVGEARYAFAAGERETAARFDVPVDLRNDVARIEIAGEHSAGAVQLLDDRWRRRTVGIASGQTADTAQPLLSGTYYLTQALQPFADVRPAEGTSPGESILRFIDDKLPVIMLADVGKLGEAEGRLGDWVDGGGVLVRFAGSRLTAASDTLVPVTLRRGGRTLGGALSWERPQALGTFPQNGPFAGMAVPGDVTVTRQVLAEPDGDLPARTWAVLADGTPLVTAARHGKGLVVLFHVTADTTWSNLPLSGSFVEMLRRLVALAGTTVKVGDESRRAAEPTMLAPARTLDGTGSFEAPPATARPVRADAPGIGGNEHPPGFYGPPEGLVAVNTLAKDATLTPLVPDWPGARLSSYAVAAPRDLAPALLLAALALLMADSLLVFALAGGAARLRRLTGAAGGAALLALALVLPHPGGARAQDKPAVDFEAALKTHLAYVVTGDKDTDDTSLAGLRGLTAFITDRTALEPGPPMGIDLARDELAFHALIYWPIVPGAPPPPPAVMAKVDAFMKSGGTMLFDTRDALEQSAGLGSTPAGATLQKLLSSLDIPELEPVPRNHVLTKTFYLMEKFPGRYDSGDTWVEAMPAESADESDRPARAGDGVSPIIITSNDLAGAWAVGPDLSPLFPLTPGGPRQREMAYRGGVNLVMYALTGNYKADQVHVPALLERLGQ